jgi:hypothetical protein
MLRQLAAAPPAPVAPVAPDELQVANVPIVMPRPAPRWGPSIWAADQPVATRDRPSVAQVDIITLSIIVAHRPE